MSISINGSDVAGMRAFDFDSSEKEPKSPSIDPFPPESPLNGDTSTPPDKAVRYKIQYKNDAGEAIDEAIQYKPWVDLKIADEEENTPVLEIITYVTIRTISVKTSVSTEDAATTAGEGPATPEKDKKAPAVKGKDLKISSIGLTEMIIRSPLLIKALRAKIEYYPGQQLSGTTITVQEPYHMLLHYRKELEQLVNIKEQKNQDNLHHAIHDKTTIAHVKVLQAFLDAKYKKKVEEEEARYARSPPFATFDMMWLLLKPGTKVYTDVDGELAAFVISSVTVITAGNSGQTGSYNVEMWSLDFDGRRIGRVKKNTLVTSFDGEREVANLKVYPIDMAPDKRLKEKLERLGERYFEILQSGNVQVDYDGDCLGKKKRYYKGRVVLDPASYWSHSGTESNPPAIGNISDDDSVSGCTCDGCTLKRNSAKPGKWAAFDNIDPKNKDTKLTKEHFLLFPRKIQGFVLKSRKWEVLDINHEKPFQPNDNAIKNLVMDPKHQKMVKILTYKYKENERDAGGAWTADFIQSKGEGQIFLLHGPPGVGKTYTAECIAELTRRPLVSLTCADIGIDEKRMEDELSKWFELAEIWGAVMLIDEVDVYLEKRQTGELQRNSLVSAFLRSMEYYRGILFLTTNRIGHIDDAIMSRVHLVLKYEPLDARARRTIWTQFIEKLEGDRDEFTVERRAKSYLLEISESDLASWNGREIRNAFQTAVALAEYDAKTATPPLKEVMLKISHFEEVIEMSKLFKEYLAKWKGDEAARALADKDRLDDDKDLVSRTAAQVDAVRKMAANRQRQ